MLLVVGLLEILQVLFLADRFEVRYGFLCNPQDNLQRSIIELIDVLYILCRLLGKVHRILDVFILLAFLVGIKDRLVKLDIFPIRV